ncbi:MAG TPA: hypothetical protein VN881_11355 [Candidatus Acidoferrales bacterium]|nr:hypothetical protein [Candidatus Acidoferrales bacterium]
MSDLTSVEKRKFEQLLGMSTGYVLDFSNRTFAEFVLESTGHDIYDARYDCGSGSKANRLRAFWQKEDNRTVGKLMTDMLDYNDETGPTAAICRLIVGRLLGGKPISKPDAVSQPETQSVLQRQLSDELRQLREEFSRLSVESDRNKAGLALEPFLNRLFDVFRLRPRQPFRVVGEQIDGSFELDSHVYLLELKWEKHALPEADLLVFRGKIEGKSTFTRGVFIALNDISAPARDAITRGKAPSFFVMNGHDLMMVLSEAISLTDFLRKRVRLLAEEGLVCVPFSELA